MRLVNTSFYKRVKQTGTGNRKVDDEQLRMRFVYPSHRHSVLSPRTQSLVGRDSLVLHILKGALVIVAVFVNASLDRFSGYGSLSVCQGPSRKPGVLFVQGIKKFFMQPRGACNDPTEHALGIPELWSCRDQSRCSSATGSSSSSPSISWSFSSAPLFSGIGFNLRTSNGVWKVSSSSATV